MGERWLRSPVREDDMSDEPSLKTLIDTNPEWMLLHVFPATNAERNRIEDAIYAALRGSGTPWLLGGDFQAHPDGDMRRKRELAAMEDRWDEGSPTEGEYKP